MKSDPCCLCGSEQYRPYMRKVYALGGRPLDLVRCRGCGLIRVEPMPGAEEVRGLYTEAYFDRDFSCGVRKGTYLESEAMRVEEYREVLSVIRSYRPFGRLLEVGCAAGSFLNYAQRSGYQVEGVDISAWAAEMAREQFAVPVHVGRLMEVNFPDETFDVIFFGDLLEHEPDPVELCREARRALKPGGLLAVKTPTYVNSFYFRLARHVPKALLLGIFDLRLLRAMKLAHEGPNLPPYHLFEYSHQNLEMLCEKAGLRVLGHRTSLLVPEFLDRWNAPLLDRVVFFGFRAMKALVMKLNLPAGHVLVLGAKE
ncbi:MAG TPA: class I SAM-dependent methyltransferase [bacterium]|nr:class I SAM-dependent methyltransferase [bacterium]